MPDVQQKVLTEPTFINGSLHPAGSLVSVDMDAFVDEDGEKITDEKRFPNLADPGTAPVLVPTLVAPIAPTGPNPTVPQQLTPGTVQTPEGFVSGGSLLIAEGHPAAQDMIDAANEANAGVEEEAVTRLSTATQGAGTAGAGQAGQAGTNGTETGFDPQPYVAGTIDAADLSGLNADQLAAVRAAEVAGQNRAGMLAKIDGTEPA